MGRAAGIADPEVPDLQQPTDLKQKTMPSHLSWSIARRGNLRKKVGSFDEPDLHEGS